MGGIAVCGHIEITLQRGFTGTADTAEEVKFIRAAPKPTLYWLLTLPPLKLP